MTDRAKHAILSPSAAHRWLRCPASIIASSGMPNPSSPYAIQGTVAHDLAYNALVKGCSAASVVPKESEALIDKEMIEHVDEYCAYVHGIIGKDFAGSKVFYEYRVEVPEVSDHTFGTLDAGVIVGDEMHIIDFKYGMGVVSAALNPQLMLYALGMYHDKAIRDERDQIEKIYLHIMQPRAFNTHHAVISVEELMAFGKFANLRAAAAYPATAKNLRYVAGATQCKYCLAKPICPKQVEIFKRYVRIYIQYYDAATTMLKPLSEKDRQFVLDNIEVVQGFIQSVQNAAQQEIMRGKEVPGWKMVPGKNRTVWKQDAATTLVKILGEEAYKAREIIPVGKARKLLTTDQVTALTEQGAYADQFVRKDDPRPSKDYVDPALSF